MAQALWPALTNEENKTVIVIDALTHKEKENSGNYHNLHLVT